jgi:micrococcal nuclease
MVRRPRPRLNRYSGELVSSRRRHGAYKVRLDLGFHVFLTSRLVSSGRLPADYAGVFDTVKRADRYRVAATHEEFERSYRYHARIEKIYDGDTVTRAIIELGFGVEFVVPLRLSGIDTPELRGSEKEAGIVSRDRLIDLILGKRVIIETEKDRTGKYGRYLATIHHDGENINDLLLDEGLAKVYGS